MNNKLKGYLAGICAAVAYGTNPLGALFLYKEGFNPASVIFYRFTFAVILLFLILKIKKVPLRINSTELKVLLALGITFAASALSLYTSFNYLDSGIASTVLFAYPIMVAVIMAVFFKERVNIFIVLSIILSAIGILMLYNIDTNAKLSILGISLVLISSLTYAVYIVIVNRSKINITPFKMTFYIMSFAAVCTFLYSFSSKENNIILIPNMTSMLWILFASIVPTIIAMTLLNIGIFYAGSTPTAIMGALEPVTAVIISITIFDGVFTLRLASGILLILISVLIIIIPKKR
ncbi:MAG: DMT family transporter [Bacteroidales bacterium]|nr:DMT family transporter [Bacteroidales bacterium]MBQ9312033.1 DMT family transporter [Bacteroidales bacterium]